MTNVIRSVEVADRAISVRLDSEAQLALEELTRRGASRSQAIRDALILAARRAWYEQAEADAKRIAHDPHDRKVIAEIREFFGEPPWTR